MNFLILLVIVPLAWTPLGAGRAEAQNLGQARGSECVSHLRRLVVDTGGRVPRPQPRLHLHRQPPILARPGSDDFGRATAS